MDIIKRCPHGIILPHVCRDCEEDIDEDELAAFQRRMDQEEERYGFGCLFPDKCCAAGMHFTSECHTAEYYEGIEDEIGKGGGP